MAQLAYDSTHRRKVLGDEDGLPLSVIMAPVRVGSAVAWYVSDKEYEMRLPAFRREINRKNKKSLPFAIQTLLDRLPRDAIPPIAQLKSLYCYGDAETNGLRAADTPAETAEKQQREDRWDARLSAQVLRSALQEWLNLFDELTKQVGTGRTPVTLKRRFVHTLASYWTEELELPLGDSRAGIHRDGQDGYFARFVLKAAEGIPEPYKPNDEWDHAIREVCRENSLNK
jgi:hypothetical protein